MNRICSAILILSLASAARAEAPSSSLVVVPERQDSPIEIATVHEEPVATKDGKSLALPAKQLALWAEDPQPVQPARPGEPAVLPAKPALKTIPVPNSPVVADPNIVVPPVPNQPAAPEANQAVSPKSEPTVLPPITAPPAALPAPTTDPPVANPPVANPPVANPPVANPPAAASKPRPLRKLRQAFRSTFWTPAARPR